MGLYTLILINQSAEMSYVRSSRVYNNYEKGAFLGIASEGPGAINQASKHRLRRVHNVNVPSVLRLDTSLTELEIFACDAKKYHFF